MSLAPPSLLAPGYKLDRYELICPIAEGGMASVWIARQTGKHGFQKLVAVKTILPKYASEPRFQQMFLDEARIASRIEHTNVTQILDVGEQHGVTYLIMEYVDGDAVSKLNRNARARPGGGTIPPGIVLRVMADVCGGLHAAHELEGQDGEPLGVVHRDVSPQNILVSTKGVAKLIDFGIAKARDRLSGDTNSETLKGKVQYMAPEQAVGQPVDRRADVWAAGAVLYHLLAGKPPFETDNDIQTLFLLSSGRPPPPMRDVHAAVASVVRRALSHAPSARFATAADMQQALEEAIVAAALVTPAATVAAYLAEHAGERAVKRREAIALGLKAAEEREKYAEIMRSNTERSRSGTPAEVITGPLARGDVNTPTSRAGQTSPTGQTLGSAVVPMASREGGRGLRFALVGGAVGASVAVLGIVALLASRPRPSARIAASAPSAAVAIALPAPPMPATPQTPGVPSAAAQTGVPAVSSSAASSGTWATAAPAAALPRMGRSSNPTATPTSGRATAPVQKPTSTRVNDGF